MTLPFEQLGEETLARVMAIETLAVARLRETMASASVVLKDATSWEGALTTLTVSVRDGIHALLPGVRVAAAARFTEECGVAALPSGTDDLERAERAAAWYAKAWAKALAASKSTWTLAVEEAGVATEKTLAGAVQFEVYRAWNDERRLAAKASGESLVMRWWTLKDQDVCKACKKLHGTYSDAKGEFPQGWPPLHVMCRCFVVSARAADESSSEGKNLMANVHSAILASLQHQDNLAVLRSVAGDVPELGETVAAPVDVPMLTRHFEVKSIDEKRRTADFVASTGVVDAHDEIVDQSTWILDDYLKNPVVLFAHQSRELPIGKSIDVQVVNGPRGQQLEHRVEFATEEMNPLAEKVWKMVVGKFLRAVSVGFIPRSYRYELRDGVEVWVWADCVLKEISVTPVPANPEALAKMKELALGGRGIDKTLRAQVRAAQSPAAPAEGSETPTSETKKVDPAMQTDAEKALQAQLDKSHLAIAELKLEAKTAGDTATKATTEKAAFEASVKTLTTEKAALEAQTKTLADDRDAQKARAEKAEEQLIVIEVESEIGPDKKLAPAEKEMFIELRRTNPALFKQMLDQRTPMSLGKPVIANNAEDNGVARSIDPSTPGANDDVMAEVARLGT